MNNKKINSLDGLFNNPSINPEHGDSAVQLLQKVINDNWYTVNRGLKDYLAEFGHDFRKALNRLSGTGHWIDGGAGNAIAQWDFLTECAKEGKEIPSLTAITYKYTQTNEVFNPKQRIFSNRRFEEINDVEIGKAQLITDFTGILNYTSELDLVLSKYMTALEPDGELFVIIPPQISFIETTRGIFTLTDWLKDMFGSKFTSLNTGGFKIRKDIQNVTIPKTKLLSAFHHHFVFRLFTEVP